MIRRVQKSYTLPKDLVKRLDEIEQKENRAQSRIIEDAVLLYIAQKWPTSDERTSG